MNAPRHPLLLSAASIRLRPGRVRELGARAEEDGTHFALAAPHAQAVELCLFDAEGQAEVARLPMPEQRDGVWQGILPVEAACGTGLVYGWRVHGPWAPQQGHRFNPAKLLLDPCARDVVGRYDGSDIHLGHLPANPALPDPRDNAASALKARVVGDLPPLTVPRPVIDPAQRVIYEVHVKGFSALHPELPPELRGTYAGLAHPACIAHLQRLGVTTLSLMPVAFRADESRLLDMGLRNYWGYSPVAWSAPETRYWSGMPGSTPRTELRALVDSLHAAGLEVLLDVVYNHSAELDELGPTLSLRGIDNALYYHLDTQDRSRYVNWTGCGNSINLNQPLVLRTVMDSLRRWVTEFGVDGFRFDLATTLARGSMEHGGRFAPHAPLLMAIAQDPVLRGCPMVAEPWDLGPDGYQLGAFPPGWLEWNDRFRDTQRGFWLQQQDTPGVLATRLAGSSDTFNPTRRGAHSSVNFITAHDGFTLRDLVSYDHRHNQANGEDNRDGHGRNLSINNGVEGETDRPDVLATRARQSRALLGALLLSLGTPMLLAGDDIGHSQRGNNNAYCQDNAISWLNWMQPDLSLRDFVGAVLALRRDCPVLQSRGWWHTEAKASGQVAAWLQADGQAMTAEQWQRHGPGTLMLRLTDPVHRQEALLLVHAGAENAVVLPPPGNWMLRLASNALPSPDDAPDRAPRPLAASETLPPTSLWVAIRELDPQSDPGEDSA